MQNLTVTDKQLEAMGEEELIAVFNVGGLATVAGVMLQSRVLKVFERKGFDVGKLKSGWLRLLRQVACGQVLPEAAQRFLLTIVGTYIFSLPIPDQKRLASGERVPLMLPNGEHLLADPLEMTREQVNQVFTKGHIRSESEQRLWLEQRKAEAAKPIPERIGKVRLDPQAGGAAIPRGFYPLADLKKIVTNLERAMA